MSSFQAVVATLFLVVVFSPALADFGACMIKAIRGALPALPDTRRHVSQLRHAS